MAAWQEKVKILARFARKIAICTFLAQAHRETYFGSKFNGFVQWLVLLFEHIFCNLFKLSFYLGEGEMIMFSHNIFIGVVRIMSKFSARFARKIVI